MGKDNICKPIIVGNKKLNRVGCSKCKTIWTDGIPSTCPVCKRRVKKSFVSNEFNK